MAKIDFTQITSGNDNNRNVGFFTLKNDGDEAIVRIMHDSVDSFDLLTTHPITVGSKYRRVNCIRDPREPLDNCPLCKAGSKVQQRLFLHMIQYVKDENGQIIPQAVVWERSASFAVTIKNLMDEYGPLSNCVFKVRRNGKAGSTDTTYSIMYGNPQIYREDMYPKLDDMFEDYSVVGTIVMDKNFDEISEFVATGAFPVKQTDVQPQAATVAYAQPQVAHAAYAQPMPQVTVGQAYQAAPQVTNVPQYVDTGAPAATPARPVRYY